MAAFMGGEFHSVPLISKPEFGNREHIERSRDTVVISPHAWVRYRQNYVDVTATQFDDAAAPVTVVELDDPRYRGKFEPLEFAEALLPMCGSSRAELKRVVALARKLLRSGQVPNSANGDPSAEKLTPEAK